MTDHSTSASAYDSVPYPNMPHRNTHPRHVEAISRLLGHTPPLAPSARVLEIGCAAGANLIPQAIDMPRAFFLGVDLSSRQIAEGQATIEALGLKNIELRCENILNIDDSWGQFDYILCHGVFSWVPPEVQDKIFEVCRINLTPTGVALISYNTYPGWHPVALIRDILMYHAAQFTDPNERISQAMAMLEFLVDHMPSGEPVHSVLKHELELLRSVNSPGYFFHEHLENVNLPIYFYQFMQRAGQAGLQYLGETDFKSMLLSAFPEAAREALKALPILQQEQYMDFLRNRRFRSTLLCQKEVALQRSIPSQRVKQFHFAPAGAVKVEGEPNLVDPSPFPFVIGSQTFTVQHRLPKAAFARLCRYPWRFVHFNELYRGVLRDLGVSAHAAAARPELSEDALADALMLGLTGGAVQIYVHPPRYTTKPGDRPEASPLARFQAAQEPVVTNQRHERVRLDPVQQAVLYRLDGKHQREDLVRVVQDMVESGKLTLSQNDQPVTDRRPEVMGCLLDATLDGLARAGLLIR